MSNEENFISFKEEGHTTTDNTSVVIYPLTPSTEYVFKVAVVTSEGQGEETTVGVTTSKGVGGMSHIQLSLVLLNSCIFSPAKLAYFQIRILDINDCEEWHVSLMTILLCTACINSSHSSE